MERCARWTCSNNSGAPPERHAGLRCDLRGSLSAKQSPWNFCNDVLHGWKEVVEVVLLLGSIFPWRHTPEDNVRLAGQWRGRNRVGAFLT